MNDASQFDDELADKHFQELVEDKVDADNIAQSKKGPGKALVTVRASDVEPEKVEWIWRDRFPRGKVSTLAGDGGLGKSTVLITMMAAVSRGRKWPNGEGQAPLGSCIYLSAEDGVADTIVPRLMAAGADLEKIHIVTAVKDGGKHSWFNLETDIELLEALAREIGDVVLIVIDPISSYLDKANSYINAEVRGLLEPLGAMAERLGAAVICNNHHSKGGSGSATSRVIGSIAFTAHSRAVTQIFEHPDEDGSFVFLPSKSNLGPKPEGLTYSLFTTQLEGGIETATVAWGAPVDITANDAMRATDEGADGKSAKDEAIDFLKDELSRGEQPVKEVTRRATDAGISSKTLRSARESLGIKSYRSGGFQGPFYWKLPTLP